MDVNFGKYYYRFRIAESTIYVEKTNTENAKNTVNMYLSQIVNKIAEFCYDNKIQYNCNINNLIPPYNIDECRQIENRIINKIINKMKELNQKLPSFS